MMQCTFVNAQNPLHTFPRNFHVDGEVANLLRTCYGETGVTDFDLYCMQKGDVILLTFLAAKS